MAHAPKQMRLGAFLLSTAIMWPRGVIRTPWPMPASSSRM